MFGLKKLIGRILVKQVMNKHFTNTAFDPNVKMCYGLLEQLNTDLFRSYNPMFGLSTYVDVRYKNMDEYVAAIKRAIILVKSGKPIDPTWDKGTDDIIVLDNLFVSNTGYYIDIRKALKEYKENGLVLCDLMKDVNIIDSGIQAHNLRMLTKLFMSIEILTKNLIDVSST